MVDDESFSQGNKFKKDYLVMWRGENHAYYLTELGIYETKFRSMASSIGVSQIPLLGGVVNRKLSKRAAANNLSLATVQALKETGKITKEILWKDVKKATLYYTELSIKSQNYDLKFKFLKHFERTELGRSINSIMAAYLDNRFTSTHPIPVNVVDMVKKSILNWTTNGTYQSPQPSADVDSTTAAREPKTDPQISQSTKPSEETTSKMEGEGPKEQRSTAFSGGRIETGNDNQPSNAQRSIISKTSFDKFKKQIALVIVIIVAVAAVVVFVHNPLHSGSIGEPSKTYQNLVYSTNAVLKSNVFAGNVTIDTGITVCTSGYNFFVTGSFINHGTIITGQKYLAQNLTSSYGGSGGGGGYSYATNSIGQNGYSTRVLAGTGGSPGSPGSSSTLTAVTKNVLSQWYNSSATTSFPDSMAQYLMGASGGLSGNFHNSGASVPGKGAFGIVIEANYIFAGIIDANGTGSTGGGAGAGGGGGGVILLLYGSAGITNGTYDVLGGSGASAGITYANNYGGNGGNGFVLQEYLTGKL